MQANYQLKVTEFTEKVEALVGPLLQDSTLSFFGHFRHFNNGQVSLLTNNLEWYYHCLKREYNLSTSTAMASNTLSFSIWMTEKEDTPLKAIYQELKVIFNIELGLSIVERNTEYCDYFLLASDKGALEILNVYLNHLTRIQAFLIGYKEQASALLAQTQAYFIANAQATVLKTAATKITRLAKKQHPLLSKRELQCALYCKEGKTAKETAKLLNLSRRTVEYYLEKVKIKLDCNSKYQLITRLYESDITRDYIK